MPTIQKLAQLLLISFSIIFFSGILTSQAFAQTKLSPNLCLPMEKKDIILSNIINQFKEKQILTGVSVKGHLLNVYVNIETGTWTVVGFAPTKHLCILDTGSGLEVDPESIVLGTGT